MIQKIKAGDFLFREGDPGDCAYIVDQGQIHLLLRKGQDDVIVAVVGAGDIVGEMSILDGLPRSASALVTQDCIVRVVSKEQFVERIDSLDPVIKMLISLLLKRLRNSDRQISGKSAPQDVTIDETLVDARERIRLESELLQALQNEEFFLTYQPIVEMKNQSLCGFEALVRWQSPTRGLVSPEDFINVAEQTSLILPIGSWIIEKAFQDLNRLHELHNSTELFMSINVSSRQFNDHQFMDILNSAQQKYDINPRNINLEVTERVFQEGPIILDTIDKCRRKGYSIALDDFGTGFSTFNSLFNLNVDHLKIDRHFVQSLIRDNKSRSIIQALIQMSKGLKIGLVAEGIESHQQAFMLRSMGCEYGQGYLFGYPQTLEQMAAAKLKKAA